METSQLRPEQKSREFIYPESEKKSKRKFDNDSDDDSDIYSKDKKSNGKKHYNSKSKTTLKRVKS